MNFHFLLFSVGGVAFGGAGFGAAGGTVPVRVPLLGRLPIGAGPVGMRTRTPVILRGADVDAWLDPGIDAKAFVPSLRLFPAWEMFAFPVSARLNKVSENDAGLIEVEN